MTGTVALVTGASSGIGRATARAFTAAGATVIVTSRSRTRAESAAVEMEGAYGPGSAVPVELDLADLASVRRAATEVRDATDRLDLLVNNAGAMRLGPRQVTADGFELHLGTNHLGHVLLTAELLDLLLQADQGRIVTVGSKAHKSVRSISWDDLQMEHDHVPWLAYSQSKLANLLFAFELQRRLDRSSSRAVSVAAHPGVAATELIRPAPASTLARLEPVLRPLAHLLFPSAARAARSIIQAATDPALRGGEHIGPRVADTWGRPVPVAPGPLSRDQDAAALMWDVSVELTGADFTSVASPIVSEQGSDS